MRRIIGHDREGIERAVAGLRKHAEIAIHDRGVERISEQGLAVEDYARTQPFQCDPELVILACIDSLVDSRVNGPAAAP